MVSQSGLRSQSIETPPTADEWVKQGDRLLNGKQFSAAVEAYNRAIELQPKLAPLHSKVGNALLRLKQFDKAVRSSERFGRADESRLSFG